ncbi:fumarylacetoacetate hydrolase family protein [Spongiibacter taiwanensis]|uniref:fumarylacetoacetate hydrolase family protein n=1 Tax=Spongiibacter taiwanensis TaxID=1748242 RepID=UPI002034DC02|nr:fumarylacetoacetate hydrolase family protein [Spongiibacter taiwanensis]USA42088.1 fumarylacetoacetate hydrolase family protein [Spongiibacter taiwanensis]
MAYTHRFTDGSPCNLTPGKVVCVGRNYAEHAKELNNPIPSSPLLFMKPASALAELGEPLQIPWGLGTCHHELELALLIGRPLKGADAAEVMSAVVGYGLALDLTLRDLQSSLKSKGHPWERAKAFDGACPLSGFLPAGAVTDWRGLQLRLRRNGQPQQQGNCRDMLFPLDELLSNISQTFTLSPGDVVITGTPPGVGPLYPGDVLKAEIVGLLSVDTRVAHLAASGETP